MGSSTKKHKKDRDISKKRKHKSRSHSRDHNNDSYREERIYIDERETREREHKRHKKHKEKRHDSRSESEKRRSHHGKSRERPEYLITRTLEISDGKYKFHETVAFHFERLTFHFNLGVILLFRV